MRDPQADHFRVQGPSPDAQPLPGVPIHEMDVEDVRTLDRLAVERYGIPSIVLMENAAIGLLKHAQAMIAHEQDRSVTVFAGPGNNGGDGLALARHLHNHLLPVRVVITQRPEQYTGDASINLGIVTRMGIPVEEADSFLSRPATPASTLLIDALFGVGLSRPVEGAPAALIEHMNRAREQRAARVLAVDCPSGLDAQTGEPVGRCVVRADRTVTLAALKPGMARVEALEYLGEVHVAPIGAPVELLRRLGRPVHPRHRD